MKENWPELERHLKEVCAEISGAIGAEHHDDMLNYIEHREFGIAYEDIVWLIEKQGIVLKSATTANLMKAGELMGLDLPPSSD